MSFFPILMFMHNYPGLAVRRLKFAEFGLLGLRLSLTMGRGASLAIEKSYS